MSSMLKFHIESPQQHRCRNRFDSTIYAKCCKADAMSLKTREDATSRLDQNPGKRQPFQDEGTVNEVSALSGVGCIHTAYMG